jgi:hypothetical protein
MLGGKDLAGRALDQRSQIFAGDSTDLDAKVLGLHVELRPVGETSGHRVEGPHQAAHRGGRLLQTRRPSRRPSFADPAHSHNRMTLAIYTRATEGMQDSATATLKRPYLDPAVDTPSIRGSVDTAKSPCFSAICRTFLSGGTRIRTGDAMIFSPRTRVPVRPVLS